MKKASHQAKSRERGAVLVMVAAATVVLMLAGALAVDLSAISTRGQTLQNAADSAALAAVETWVESGSQADAIAIVDDMLAQNGVGTGDGTTAVVTFPSATQVDVELVDGEPDMLLGGVAGLGGDITRGATAQFEQCDVSCSYEVEIPPPFGSVEAVGSGDGYKPIPVGTKLYAIHHDGTKIVCVDRLTQNPCWSPAARNAYSPSAHSSMGSGDNPHMPHAVVVGSRIWWSTTDSVGHKLFCWETVTDVPCTTSYLLANLPEANNLHNYESNRGGGTTLIGGKIYVFTDDHNAHCFDPSLLAICPGYAGGRLTGLGIAGFPPHDPSDGNHGASMDRIFDETTGHIYVTLHINTAFGAADCSNPMTNPDGRVIIQNRYSLRYVQIDGSNVRRSTNGTSDRSQWITDEVNPGEFTFESFDNGRYLDGDSPNSDVDTSSSIGNDDHWEVTWNGVSATIQNVYRGGWLTDDGSDVVQRTSTNGIQSEWFIWPWQCGDPGYTPPANPPGLGYTEGTWLHCWDPNGASGAGAPCSGFTPTLLHTNALRSSGRLWFHRMTDGTPQGVCSSGFDGSISASNFEINCVDYWTGLHSATFTNDMVPFANAIDNTVGSSLSSWGDPHWNEHSNRTFYPSHHNPSKVFCWDWDSNSSCGSRTSSTPNLGETEDYGYFSEGNCVYGLGHNSIFWAFQGENINQPCAGSSATTTIQPCPCGTTLAWGTIEFDVDLPLFDVFDLQILDPDGNIVFPIGAEATPDESDDWWSLLTDGTVVDLNEIPTTFTHLEVIVQVESEHDPWATGQQTFTITFANSPHLVD